VPSDPLPAVDNLAEIFRLAPDLTGNDVVVCDLATGQFLDCSSSAHSHLGYSREEFLSLGLAGIQAKASHNSAWVEGLLRQIQAHPRGTFLSTHRCRNGEIREVQIHHNVVWMQGQQLLLAAIEDLTLQREAERELGRLNLLLSEAEQLSAIGSWEINHSSGEVTWSPETFRLLGSEAGLEIPSMQGFLNKVHSKDRDLVAAGLRQSWLSGQPFQLQHRVVHVTGEERLLLHRGRTHCDTSGQPLRTIATLQDITERRSREEQLEAAALTDSITGLPNKRASLKHLESLLLQAPYNQQIALVCLDLDNFQSINDSFGVEVGNQVLRWTAEQLTLLLQPGDWLARLASDEFLIIRAEGVGCLAGAIQLAQALQTGLGQAVPLLNPPRPIQVTACAGVSMAPDHSSTAVDLLQCANTALMEAKHQGKRRLQTYSTAMSQRIREQLDLENQLARAIEHEELQLYFQPQYNRSNALIGAEALLRWRTPRGTEIQPSRFIPLAEQSGLIHPIGQWVLEHSLEQLRAWRQQGLALPRLAINVSGLQFDATQEPLSQVVAGLLERLEIPSEQVELELTESTLITNPERAIQQLEDLAAQGISLAIDDFGTGFSSLALLQRLPLHLLKIDRCFVERLGNLPADYSIVKATILMAHELGLQCLAEGVETEQQLVVLKELGCDAFQGYLFQRPLSTEAMTVLLQEHANGVVTQ
jgi:diguanylate cyclase (GGDEF)-like protein/PAS domain S-box-containing protein